MRNFKKITLLFLLSVLFFQTANAQQIEVKATIDSTDILIGQQTLIHLEVVQPKEVKVNFPVFGAEDTLTANVEIISISKADTSKAENDRILIRQDYLITSFDSGSYVIPPFKFQLIDRNFQTNSLTLNVNNVQVNRDEDIKEIKPIYRLPFDWLFLFSIIGLVLLVLALVGGGIYLYLKWKKKKPVAIFKEPEITPPHEIALQKLMQIKEEKIWQKGQDKLYYTQLTDVLREYFTARFDIQAMEMTSIEILDALQTEEEAKTIFDKLKQILNTSDMVKFAKLQSTIEENEQNLANAFLVVEQCGTSTNNTNRVQSYHLQFFGKGSEYFAIMIVNWLLMVVTLGIYYPWARAKRLKYIYGQTALNDQRFNFAGTGKEMFRGFIKVILFYLVVMVIYTLFIFYQLAFPAILVLLLAFFAIYPLAIHGSLRYRMSRTSYRGIRFGYRGDRAELFKNCIKWGLLTLVTFGIYGAWMSMNVRRYTHQNIRYGNIRFSNKCNGTDWFLLNLVGYFLTLITLGIYSFWWQRDIFNYYINNMSMQKGEQKIRCYSTATGGGFFKLLAGNFLITAFTLGVGKAWADMRTQHFIWNNIKMEGNINLDKIHQTEEEYTNAFGEDAMDFFEIDLA